MNSTPQSASGRVARLQDRARHRAVPARLAHQQEPQVVQLGLEVQLALEHRRARDRRDAADDDARRHPLRVGVDRGDRARRAHQTAAGARSAASAASRIARSSASSASRGARTGPPTKPSASCAPLKYCTSFGVMSSRASGSSRA